jgi:transcriptional regulator with XRE-family HTH domain
VRGLTQVELAHRLGTTQTVVSDYEIGRRRIHLQRAQQIAAILNVSVDDLLAEPTARTNGNGHGELSLKLVRRLKCIEALPRARQKAVLQTLDFLLKGAGS